MRNRMCILAVLFVFGFFFALTFHAGLQAGDDVPDPDRCYPGREFSCCIDALGRHGAWINVPRVGLVCNCDGVPGYPTINGPCECQMDCYQSGNNGQ